MNQLNVCRLCLTENENTINIFDENGKNLKIAHVLSKHFWFQVLENDDLSKIICSKCWWTTENFHEFYETIEVAQKKLNKINASINILSDANGFQREIKYENSDDADVFQSTSTVEANVSIDPIIKYDADYQEEKFSIIEDSVDINFSDNTRIESDDSKDDVTCQRKRKPLIRKRKSAIKLNNSSDNQDEIKRLKKEKLEKEDAQIREYFKMECCNCDNKFVSFLQAKSHYQKMHGTSGHLLCCNRKFFRRGRILEHIERHKNPDNFRCEICNKVYVDKFALKNHLEDHQPITDRQYKCTHCDKSFAKQYKLSQHIRTRHSVASDDKRFSCDICGNSFTTKSLLSLHIRGVHQFAFAHVCDICAKVFKSKQVFESHRQLHFTAPPKLQCNICGAWLANNHSLRSHLARHKDVEHKCSLCDKVAPNKQALDNHMRNVHIGRLFQCSMCDKSFKKPIGLKEHMALHTGENLYTCPYCPKTFKSGANMHSHRKKAHLAEWERDRKRRVIPVKSK